MSWHRLMRGTAMLRGFDGGEGPAVVFQHGLGGDEAQVAEAFPPEGFRRLTLECRAQGQSEAGDPDGFSIPAFAEDVLAFAAARGLGRFAVGGISMGAAIALRIAVTAPERVSALILSRPAWTWDKAPENMQAFAILARYLAAGDRDGFERTDVARDFAVTAPDNLASLRKFFDVADRATTAKLLAAIASDGPRITEAEVRALDVPTLVIGNAVDRVHPLSHARLLAAAIPGARLVEVAPKVLDKPRHLAEFRAAVADFLHQQGSST
jgi:pimeloyl-ACP methyl ester carboxylesterase